MNFGGALSMDGLASVSSLFSSESEPLKESNSKQRGLFESGLSKHGRWDGVEENDWNRFNMAKGDSMLAATSSKEQSCFLRSSSSHSLFPHGEKMLSFTSTKPDAAAPLNADWALQFYRHPSTSSSSSSAPLYLRNAGMGFGNSTVSMPGIVAGVRGPFTPSQWVELEHQALIYKYIIAKVPIPSSLLAPMRRSLYPSLFPVFSAGSYNRSASTLAWGSFHPGFSGSSDPEPGRCRRTDGKKWRCSRDAVADQKYCERHLNRVRHRSRKHVEGHNGHATKAAMPAIITCSQSASVASGGNLSKNLTVAQQQRTSLKPSMTDQSPVQLNRLPPNKENTSELARNSRGPSMLPNLSPKSTGVLLPILKQQNPFEGTSAHADFDLICTDSLVNPQGSSYSENISFAVSNSEINCQPSSSHHLRCFFDELPKNSSDRSTFIWPDADEMQSDRTQLSISIPMASLDKSSSSSPNQGKHSFSPHRLSSEFNTLNDDSQRYSNWVPISWEPTIGGPLGEVVTNKSTTPKDLSRNLISSSSLNLLTDGWNSSPIMESSPTGVLQKTSFGSLSSSAGSSPRAEIENDERNET